VEGGASSAGAPADEDTFEKQIRLINEASAEQLRSLTTPKYVNPQVLDQLEEWMKETPIPYISNDKFSQEGIFTIGLRVCQDTLMSTNRTRMSLGCGDLCSSMVALHLEAG